jgi:apolipoprotein N-acyltransferase
VWRLERRPFALGLIAGSVYFGGTLYWVVETMTTFGGMSTALATLAAVLLVAYLSLFPAAFAVILSILSRSLGSAAVLLAPAIWVTSEVGREHVWDGFPWALLGYSQVTVLPIAQLASLVGVYGLSALLAATSAAAAYIALERGRRAWLVGGITIALVAACGLWGAMRLRASPLTSAGETVRAAVVQGNIPQTEKWDPAFADAITSRYLTMTRQALTAGATFVIWPESATPFYFEQDVFRGGLIRRLARQYGATLLIGSDQVEPVTPVPPGRRPEYRSYNAAFLIKPDGSVGGVYRKMHLVPFGEYVPAQRILFFVSSLVQVVADFAPYTPGTDPALLPVGGHYASTAICYEVIYGSLMRSFILEGSELLTTITNDAWYGRSSAPYQHWEQASMRAIEDGRYLARAANTGISGFVDPYGRVLQQSVLFQTAILMQDVRFLTARTLYSRIGDLLAWLSVALTAAALLAAWRMK